MVKIYYTVLQGYEYIMQKSRNNESNNLAHNDKLNLHILLGMC